MGRWDIQGSRYKLRPKWERMDSMRIDWLDDFETKTDELLAKQTREKRARRAERHALR